MATRSEEVYQRGPAPSREEGILRRMMVVRMGEGKRERGGGRGGRERREGGVVLILLN